ncbi:acetyl-CoA carboxylase biotin carboxyl carrier protein [Apibacter raozihei]|uniref:acetyl-CoA carboxylase biotin carboxyl carrier protein n=1 Tax=Apibacter TaxID=1778601 RepID=UPI000FE36EC2|nr:MULTISPECIES: acetyl-CoA carboxylase biotin carboxyl carrier protein [Apibacter]
MDIKDIQNLIRFVSKSDVAEVTYKTEDFEISIKTNNGSVVYTPSVSQQQIQSLPQVSAPAEQPSAPATVPASTEDTSKYITIKSPMIGTFYRKPSPDKSVFTNVGDTVSIGSVVCVIEAMKLFNEIESEVSGKIVKILVDDASPVEFDQPLFLVDPS